MNRSAVLMLFRTPPTHEQETTQKCVVVFLLEFYYARLFKLLRSTSQTTALQYKNYYAFLDELGVLTNYSKSRSFFPSPSL